MVNGFYFNTSHRTLLECQPKRWLSSDGGAYRNHVLAAVLGFDAVLSLSKHTLQRAQLLNQRTARSENCPVASFNNRGENCRSTDI